MRVLLDECVPRRLGRELIGHDVRAVSEMGWGGTKNGALLKRAAEEFDVLLTIDQGFQFQQNVRSAAIAVVIVAVGSNDIDVLRAFVPGILEALRCAQAGELLHVRP